MSDTTERPRIAFVGLGAMGAPMAARLAVTHEVIGVDPVTPQGPPAGVEVVTDLAAASGRVDLVCLSLPSPAACDSVVTRIIAQNGPRPARVLDLSTIGVEIVRDLAGRLAEVGVGYVDAPVSGGVLAAGSGTLSTMVAGASADLEAVRPVLDIIADKVYVMGAEAGLGQVMKVANNICALTSILVTSEAVAYGVSQGLDMALMIDVINGSTGRTHASEFKFPRSIIPGTYDYGARGEITAKDVHLYVHEAERTHAARSVATAADAMWQGFIAAHPETDFTYVYEYIRGLARDE